MSEVKEITVLVITSYEQLDSILVSSGFNIKLNGIIDDIYMLPNSVNYKDYDYLELSKYFVIIRNWKDNKKELLYKNKKYDSNGNIICENKTECYINDILDGINFMKSIGYREFIHVKDDFVTYTNGDIELCVQRINDKYIFIEYEGFNGEDIDSLKEKLDSLNLPYDKSSYFMKKAEFVMKDGYKNES